MTNEEAIKELKEMKLVAEERGSYWGENAIPLYELAISALESIESLKAERDAAIRDLRLSENKHESCEFCKYYNSPINYCTTEDGNILCDTFNNDMWEWRGVQNGQTY